MLKIQNVMETNKKVGEFGIKFLDDRLVGILQSDLIVVGARSGAGKSTIAELIAAHNRHEKVSLFSLEDFEGDCLLKKAYYRYVERTCNYSIPLRAFVSGSVQFDMIALKEAEQYAEKCFEGINVIHRKPRYGIEELKNDIMREAEVNESKLIILDHLDYVSKYSNESDNQHINELMRTIREVQDAFKVAVVAISHLRKSINTKEAPIIPSMEEFIGSGNKYKEATAVIMLAPDDEGNFGVDMPSKSDRLTWCSIRKLRMGGYDNQAAKLIFDTKTGRYVDSYSLYRVNYSGTKVEPV